MDGNIRSARPEYAKPEIACALKCIVLPGPGIAKMYGLVKTCALFPVRTLAAAPAVALAAQPPV